MAQKPLVSILLPTHNRADVISCAIHSVLAQSVTAFELLVVGDGCTDDTPAIVTKIAKKDSRVQWFDFPKGPGFGYAHRNVVLKKAKGKYVAFAPHDDLWFPDHLEKCVDFLEHHPDFQLVYTQPLWIDPKGTIVPSLFTTELPSLKKQLVFSHNEIPAQCVVHTRKSMEEVGYWNAELPKAADWDLWKRIILNDPHQRVGFIPEPTGLHFRAIWRNKSTSADDLLHKQWELVEAAQTELPLLVNSARINTSTKPQQQLVWEEMSELGWVEEIRRQTTACVTYLARTAIRLTIGEKDELSRIKDSRSYKLVQLLQKLFRLTSAR